MPRDYYGNKITDAAASGPNPVDYQMSQAGLENAPNYDKLSRTERWVGRVLPGIADSNVGQALARFSESWAGKALQYLDVGAETVERATGLGAQLIYAYGGGSKLDPAAAKDVISNINAAWYAGSLAADMANFSPQYDPETNSYKIPTDLPGIQGLVDARHKIEDYMNQGMSGGEALAKVRDEYYNSEGALALRSQMQDTFVHIFGDPLIVALPFLRPVERTAEFRNALRSKVLAQTVGETVNDAQHIKLGISIAERQLDNATNYEDIVALDRHLANLREELPIVEDAVKFARENQLTPFQEKMVSVLKLLPDEALPDTEKMSKLGRLAYRLNPFALTPGSRAYELMNTVLQRIQTTIFHSGGGPNEWVRAIVRAADGQYTPELAHSLLTIEGRAVRSALTKASNDVQGLLGTYNELEKLEGPFIRNMSALLDTTPDKIIRRLANDEGVALASQYMQKLSKLAPEERASVEMLLKVNGMDLTEKNLLDVMGRLKVYEKFVGWNDTMFQFEAANAIVDGIQQMALSHFGLKARGTVLQIAEAMKSAESLAFLKMNPAYPLRNWMNNFFTTIARGTYGNPFRSMENFFLEHGLSEPPRLRSGVGMSGEIDFTAAAERTLTASLEHGAAEIRRIENPQTGKIGAITKFFQRRRGLGFGQLAQTFERQASIRAYTSGFLRHYKQTNAMGKGLTTIEEFSPELARSLGGRLVKRIQKAVENSYTHSDIDNIVSNANLNLTMGMVLDEASQKTGLPIERILNDDFTEFIRPRLEEAMQKGTASFRAEINNVRRLINDQIESHVDNVNYTILEQTAARVNAESVGALPPVFAGLMDDSIATAERHAMDMSKIGNDIAALPADAKKAFWDNLLGDNEKFYNRFWDRSENTIKGVEKGLDDAMEQMRIGGSLTPELEKGLNDIKVELRSNFEQWRDGWQEFFNYRNEKFKDLRRLRSENKFNEVFDNLQIELDKRYKKLIDAEEVHMGRMDEVVSRGLPEDQRNMFLYYRSRISEIRRELRESTLNFRRAVREAPADARAAMWQDQFWPERLDILKRLETAERDMRVAMQGDPNAQRLFGLTQEEASRIGDIQRRFLQGEDLPKEDTALLDRVRANIRETPEIDKLRTQWGTYSKRQMADYFTGVQSDIRGQPVLDESVRHLGVGEKVTGGQVVQDAVDLQARDLPDDTRKWLRDWAQENDPIFSDALDNIDSKIETYTPPVQKELPEGGPNATFLQKEMPKVRQVKNMPLDEKGNPNVYQYMLEHPDDTFVFRYTDPLEEGLEFPYGVTGDHGGIITVTPAFNKEKGKWGFRFTQWNEGEYHGMQNFGVPIGHITPYESDVQEVVDKIMHGGLFNNADLMEYISRKLGFNPKPNPYKLESFGVVPGGTKLDNEKLVNFLDQRRRLESELVQRMRDEYFTPSEALKLWTQGKISKSQFLKAAKAHPKDLERIRSLTQWQLREQGVTVVKAYANAEDLSKFKAGAFDRLKLDRAAAQRPRIGFGGLEPGQVVEFDIPVGNVLIHPSAHPGMDSEIVLTEDGIKGARVASIDGREVSTPEFKMMLGNNPDIAGAPATMSAMSDFHNVVPEELLLGKGVDELWFTRGASAMDAIENAGLDAIKKPALSADIPEEMRSQMMGYLDHVKGEQSRNLYASYRMGEWHRDTALLNYNRRLNYNNWLGAIVPYEFWATNTAFRWAIHSLDRPAMLSNFLRIRKFLATAYKPENGFPSRLQGSIRVPMPFLPDWMGKDLFIDPLRTALPFDQMMYGVERAAAQKKSDIGKAERVLEELHNDNKISDQEYQQALATHQGSAWERAISLGQQDDSENRLDAFDTVSMMLSPHAPLMWAHNIARGTPEQIGPFLPITRSIKGVSALLGISPETGGVNPEASIRKALGLPAFDAWDDYRIDRMLSNMAADGEYSVDQVKRAMIDRKGEVFIEARRRAGIEYGWGALGSALAMPAKAYPTGEEEQRNLATQYQQAWRSYESGQIGAVKQFYNDHPEYEARLALWDKPEDRLRNFLVGNLWDMWHNMPKVNQDEVKDQLGDMFQRAFLDKQTRSTDSIDLNTLQYWVKVMGGNPPGKMGTSPNIPPLELTDKDTAYRVQVFYDARERMFDYYNKIAPLQNEYYHLKEGAARRQFKQTHPELNRYWEWRRDFMQRNPSLAPFITDNPDQLPKYSSEQQLQQAQQGQPNYSPAEWENYLGSHLYRLVLDDAPLPPTAQRALDQLGVSQMEVRDQIMSQLQ